MLSCFGSRKKSRSNSDTQPLLPQYEGDTSLQRIIHQKLHSYQMIRALSKGYMPSTEQVIASLRILLASDVLNPEAPGLSDSGRLLLRYTKQWLSEFIELLRNKNDCDQFQDFVWFLWHAKVSINAQDNVQTASSTRAKADVSAAYESMKTVGDLLLTNSDFRLLLSNLNIILCQVFADTAETLSNVADNAATQIEPSTEDNETLKKPGSEQGPGPTTNDLVAEAAKIGTVVAQGLKDTGKDAGASLKENVSGDQRDTLLFRIKIAVTKLRKRNDYTNSVSTVSLLIQRYAKVYSRAAGTAISTVQEDINANEYLDRAIKAGWSFLSSFGDKNTWKELEVRLNKVMEHSQKDPEFEKVLREFATSIQEMLTDPEFFESAGNIFGESKEKSKEIDSKSLLRQDIRRLLQQARVIFHSIMNDQDVSKLVRTSQKIWSILFPDHRTISSELLVDTYTVFIPHLIQAIQYTPIPRLEILSPEVDLLLESLVLEPGHTINNSSFLPFKFNIETYNDLTIRKARTQIVSTLKTLVTVNIQGLSVRADEFGFWLRVHKGLLRFADEGIASFELDGRGIDISLRLEIGRDRLEEILSLRGVRVKIHHLNYTVRKSKFSCLSWFLKPVLQSTIRKVLERKLSKAITDGLHAANRELVYARERLRATRISNPQDLRTFVKAVITRLKPAEDPDLCVRVDVTGSANQRCNVFAGVYTPASVVKLWQEEAAQASERVDDNATQGWKNGIFDSVR